jgi:hypothetical protein
MSLVVEAVHQDLNARDNVQERHRRLLARATDLRREADRRDYEMALRSLAREVAEETNLMSGDINAVIQMVAGRGRTPADVQ